MPRQRAREIGAARRARRTPPRAPRGRRARATRGREIKTREARGGGDLARASRPTRVRRRRRDADDRSARGIAREEDSFARTDTVGGCVNSGPANGRCGGNWMYPDPTTRFGFCDARGGERSEEAVRRTSRRDGERRRTRAIEGVDRARGQKKDPSTRAEASGRGDRSRARGPRRAGRADAPRSAWSSRRSSPVGS